MEKIIITYKHFIIYGKRNKKKINKNKSTLFDVLIKILILQN